MKYDFVLSIYIICTILLRSNLSEGSELFCNSEAFLI